MRKLLASAMLVSLAWNSAIAQGEKVQEVTAPIKSVIIYLTNAEVSQSKQVTLEAGRNRITFTGLSAKLIPRSIQATVSGDAAILSVTEQINYLSVITETPRVKQLKDSVLLLNETIARLRGDREAYDIEKKMMLANQSIGGNEKGVAVAELKLAADLFRSRMKEINAELLRLDTRVNQLSLALNNANNQLAELNAKSNIPTAEISVLLSSPTRSTQTIDLHYLVTDAAWQAIYDLRAEDIDKPVQLTYRAQVYNNTGIDWNDVKVKLSTADPNKSASKPELETWWLDFNSGQQQYQYNEYNKNAPAPAQNQSLYEGYLNNADVYKEDDMKKDKRAVYNQAAQFEQIQVSELSAEFDIKTTYTIPADAKPYLVDVTSYNIPAVFQHYSVPKVDRDVFLIARITGWEELDLVEGPANVYYGGTYVGQSYINTRSVDDTLMLSLGRDNKVVVTRTKLKDFSSIKSIAGSKKETYGYEMVVKNNRKAPINIELYDQLPVSKQNEIEVEAIELSKADHDLPTGKLKWNLSVAPAETKKIQLSFSIKYPKNKAVQTRKYQTRSRAKY